MRVFMAQLRPKGVVISFVKYNSNSILFQLKVDELEFRLGERNL